MKKTELKKLISECYKEVLKEDSAKSPIHLWVYWSYNYPSDFIETIWRGNQHMIDHLTDKFHNIYKSVGSAAVMNKFYVELDYENSKQLETWVLKNYRG